MKHELVYETWGILWTRYQVVSHLTGKVESFQVISALLCINPSSSVFVCFNLLAFNSLSVSLVIIPFLFVLQDMHLSFRRKKKLHKTFKLFSSSCLHDSRRTTNKRRKTISHKSFAKTNDTKKGRRTQCFTPEICSTFLQYECIWFTLWTIWWFPSKGNIDGLSTCPSTPTVSWKESSALPWKVSSFSMQNQGRQKVFLAVLFILLLFTLLHNCYASDEAPLLLFAAYKSLLSMCCLECPKRETRLNFQSFQVEKDVSQEPSISCLFSFFMSVLRYDEIPFSSPYHSYYFFHVTDNTCSWMPSWAFMCLCGSCSSLSWTFLMRLSLPHLYRWLVSLTCTISSSIADFRKRWWWIHQRIFIVVSLESSQVTQASIVKQPDSRK